MSFRFRVPGSHPLWLTFPRHSTIFRLSSRRDLILLPLYVSLPIGLGFSHFARHYFGNVLFSSGYLDVSVHRVPSFTLFFHVKVTFRPGFPIRIFRDRRSFTAPPDFSQCPTSFFGIQRQGIPRKLLVAFYVMQGTGPSSGLYSLLGF